MIPLKSRQSSRVGHTQMVRIWWLLLSLAVAVIAVPGMSSAENAEFVGVKNRATQAFKAGRFDEAAKLFEEAFDLNPLGNLLYNIAFCYEKSGNKTAAIKFYKRFLDAVPGAPQKTELLERISRLAKSLDSRYRQVKVVTEPAGAYIFIDDRANGTVGQAPLNLSLLPGQHKLIAHLDKHEPVTRVIQLTEGEDKTVNLLLTPSSEFVDVKFMVSERGANVMVDRRKIGTSPLVGKTRIRRGRRQIMAFKEGFRRWSRDVEVTDTDDQVIRIQLEKEGEEVADTEPAETGTNIWPWVTVGVGVATIGGGIATGMLADGLYEKLEQKRSRMEPIAPSDIDTGNGLVLMTNVLLGVGTAVVAGGVTWYFLQSDSDEPEGDITTVFMPMHGGGAVHIGGQF